MTTHQVEFGDLSCGEVARRLLAEGADRRDKLQMLRGGKPVLIGGVGWFADRTIREDAKVGPCYVKWRPFPDARRRSGTVLAPPKAE